MNINPQYQLKQCSKCNHQLPVTAFSRDRRSKDGYRSACKSCDSFDSFAVNIGRLANLNCPVDAEAFGKAWDKHQGECARCGTEFTPEGINAAVAYKCACCGDVELSCCRCFAGQQIEAAEREIAVEEAEAEALKGMPEGYINMVKDLKEKAKRLGNAQDAE